MVLRKSPPRSKPLRLNGLKSYHYDIENYPDPVNEKYPFDGVYWRTTPDNGPFYLSEYARSDGTTIKDYLASFGKKYDKLNHRYNNLDTFVSSLVRKTSKAEDAELGLYTYAPAIIVAHDRLFLEAACQAARTPGKGYGIAIYYDPSFEGVKGIDGAGKGYKQSLPPNPLWENTYNGNYNPHSELASELGSPSKDVYYHVTFTPDSTLKDLGVQSEKELIHKGILSEKGFIPKKDPYGRSILMNREGYLTIKTAEGEYAITRVSSPPKIKGKDTSFSELS